MATFQITLDDDLKANVDELFDTVEEAIQSMLGDDYTSRI